MFWLGILTPPIIVALVFATLLMIGRGQHSDTESATPPLSHPYLEPSTTPEHIYLDAEHPQHGSDTNPK